MDFAVFGNHFVGGGGVVDCCVEVTVLVVGRFNASVTFRIAETDVHTILTSLVENRLHAGGLRWVAIHVTLKVGFQLLEVGEEGTGEEGRERELGVDDQLDVLGVGGGHKGQHARDGLRAEGGGMDGAELSCCYDDVACHFRLSSRLIEDIRERRQERLALNDYLTDSVDG